MNIGVDARFIHDLYSSIGVFQRNIIKNLVAIDRHNSYYIFLAKEGETFIEPTDRSHAVPLKGTNLLLSNRAIAKDSKRLGVDVFFATFNISPRFSHRVRVVLQNHDFSHGRHDLSFRSLLSNQIYRYLHARSVRESDFLLANSSFTKAELKRMSRGQPIRVIYHDCDPEFKQEHFVDIRQELPPQDMILYAGRVAPKYKNIQILLRAFSLYSKERPGTKLALVYSDHFRIIDQLFLVKNRHRVILFRKIPRKLLIRLYRSAKMFIYPSSYEGFGSPLLEAQNSGCPLIANIVPPLPEIAGDGGIYYNGSSKELAAKMLHLAKDEALRENIIQRGRANSRRFNWRTTAQQTLECLNSFA